jgi:hypothetical protein
MLKITTHAHGAVTLLELEGKLAGPWVKELADCWHRTAIGDQRIRVILRAVTFIDGAGRKLLAEMHRQGTELVAEGCMTKAIVEEIQRRAI